MRVSPHDINCLIPKLRPDCNVSGESRPKTLAELKQEAKRKLIYRMAGRLAPKYCLTAFRHSWCHHALRRGIDALTVSVLMGHADPSMVARVYSHLSHATDYLHDAAQRAVG
jgi:integrase